MPNAQNNVTGQIQPTLFIGLGGTGKEVLLRLRRKFCEKFGKPSLPCASFLCIDADPGDKDATGVELDAVFESVRFEARETVALLNGQVSSDVADVIMNPGQWPQIHDWLYPEVERHGTEISDVASGVRALGRLKFFKRFAEAEGLATRVREALHRLLTIESIQDTERVFADMGLGTVEFANEKRVQVFLICSMAGGTGGGTMLDTAFYLRHLSQQKRFPIGPLYGVAFLPNVYYADPVEGIAQRSFGNAYAALKELEFYSLRQGGDDNNEKFSVEWEKGNTLEIQGPPFSAVYLQEMCNEAGVTLRLENRHELFTSVAESLFLDFMPSAFSTQKRSQFSPLLAELSGYRDVVIHHEGVPLQQHFARRYASFGFSKIEMPLDAILNACSSELASEMLACILRDDDNTYVRRDVENKMNAQFINEPEIQNLFDDSWKEAIRNEVGAVYRNRSAVKPQDIDDLEALFATLETKLVGADPTETGEIGLAVGLLRENTMRAVGKAEAWLTKWVQEGLEDGSHGLKSLVKPAGYLPYAKSNLERLYKAVQVGEKTRFETLRKEATADAVYFRRRWDTHIQELRISQNSLGIAALGMRRWTTELQLGILKESHEKYLVAKAAVGLYDECMKVALVIATGMEQLKTKLEKFQLFIEELRADLHEQSEQFLQFGAKVLFIQVFDRERNWKDFYRLAIKDKNEPQEVKPSEELAAFLRQRFSPTATLLDLVESFQGKAVLEKELTDYCETRFRHEFKKNRRSVNLLQSSLFKDEPTAKQTIASLVRNASPMMRIKTDLAGLSFAKIRSGRYEGAS